MTPERYQGVRSRPIPARAGMGLRPEHYAAVTEERPAVAWLEVHSENHFSGARHGLAVLEALRCDYPMSFHGVGLSLGGTDPLDHGHLDELAALVERFQPALVSDHLAWTCIDGRHFNDLLPLPYTEEALENTAHRVNCVQDRLGRRILVENPSTYIAFEGADYSEQAFLAALADRTGCGLLVDVNNVYVNACNHGWSAEAWLEGIPPEAVAEIHLAGHIRRSGPEGDVLIDTHNARVCPAVWALFDRAIALWGPRPSLIEWDQDLPDLAVLLDEARLADRALEASRESVAS